jgi:hypothetical protein
MIVAAAQATNAGTALPSSNLPIRSRQASRQVIRDVVAITAIV